MNTKCIVKKRTWIKGNLLNRGDHIEIPYGAVSLLVRQGKIEIYNPAAPKKTQGGSTKKNKKS